MNYSWIVCCMLLLTGSISFTNGETTKEVSTSTIDYNSNNINQDYPVSYDDYQDPDYPVPDYYGEEREGRSLGNEIPDPASDENYLRQLESTIPGIPGVDYPMYQSVPDTSFRCDSQKNSAGFFGDVEAQCQVFHICQEDGRHDSFLCPIGTVFNQMNLICDWWFNFKCDDTSNFFSMNADLQRPPRMQDAMKKMRRFRETDSNSMPESKIDRGRQKMIMSDMDRYRILNLFSPKMRSGNIWKRLMTTEKLEDGMSKASTAKSEELRSFGSTDISDYTTSDFLTTMLTTTDSTPDASEKGYSQLPSEVTAVDLSTNVNHNSILQSMRLHDSLVINSTEINDKELNVNDIETTFAIPTSNEKDTTFTTESVAFDESSIHNNEHSNRFLSSFDVSEDNQTDIYANNPQDKYYNYTSGTLDEISIHSKQLNSSMGRSMPRHVLNNSSKLELRGKPTAKGNSSLTLKNDTHITVSVTIRAGISRLKWKRLPEVRKNMKLKTDSGISLNDSENDSPMDLVFRRRKMRNRPSTRIMWIPAKNDTLKRKSIWKILVNSKPRNGGSRNASRLLYNLMDLDKHAFAPMQKNSVVENIYIDPNVSEDNNFKEDDISSTTLQTDNTEMAFSFMRPSETDLFSSTSSSKIIFDEPIALALTDNRIQNNEDSFEINELVNSEGNKISKETETFKENLLDKQSGDYMKIESGQENEKFETTTETKVNDGCRRICVKFLQSIGSSNGNTNDISPRPVSTLRETETLNEYIPHSEELNLKAQFSRRSFLGVPPTEQWSVKYDPDPQCNEDIEEGKAPFKGWSIIVDAGSVTKEKTVKRRGCDNLFNDSKIIVMKSLKPHQRNIPGRGNSKTNYPHHEENDSKIHFGSTDQQYWLSLVRNWLDAAPNSKLKAGPASFTNTDAQHPQKRFPPVQRNKYDINDSPISKPFNMRNSKSDWKMNENRRNNWQNDPDKKISKNGFNQGSISRRNSGSNAGSKWVWSKEQDSDVISSQSNRKEWHVDAENKMDSIRDSLSDNWNDQKATLSKNSAQKWTQNSMHSDNAFKPRNGASDWSLEDNKSTFPKTRNGDGPSRHQTDNLHPSSYQQSNENGSDEDDKNSQQDFRSRNLRGKRDWESQQRNRYRPNLPMSTSSGLSGGETSKIPWSSDYFNENPSSTHNVNYQGTLKTNNRNQWSDDIGTKISPSDELYKMSWSSGNNGSATTDRRRDSSDTNTKSDWSTKTADPDWSSKSNTNQKSRPSIKGDGFDTGNQGNKPNRDGRRIPEDWDARSKENRPFPGQTDEIGWITGDSKTSSRPKSSSSSNKDKAWSSRDEQQRSDRPSDKRTDEEWSFEDQQRKTNVAPDSKMDQAWTAKDQQGMDDWASNSKKDNAWSSGDQQGITDWPSDSKQDSAWSSKDQQGKNDWASGNKRDPSWSSGDQQGKTDAWSDSKKDQSRSPGSEKGRDWPSGNQKGRTWSPGDQQQKSDWPSSSKMNKDWSSRDQQDKSDMSTSIKSNGNKWPDSPSNRKEFPTQNKGSSSPPLSNGKDNFPRKDKGTARDTFQKDISQSAFNENDDWSTKQNVKRPVWSSDENDDAFNAKQKDDDPFLDNKKEESGSFDAPLNINNKENKNRRPNSRAHTDTDYRKNTPDSSSGSSWNPDSSVDNTNGWSSDSFNGNKPDQQPTRSKGDNTRGSSFPINGDTRRTTNSKGVWDSDFKTSTENIPSDSNSAWRKDRPFDPPLSKGGSSDDSFQNSETRRTDNRNKGSSRNSSSLPSSWSDGNDRSYSTGSKGQNSQSDWSNEDNKPISTRMSNRRDEMNSDWWWDADEELGSSSKGQDSPSWSGAMNDDGWSSDIKPDWSSEPDENKMSTKKKGDWSSNTRDNRMSKKTDEDWSSNKRLDWSSKPSGNRMPNANDNKSSKRNPDWSTQTSRTPTSKVNRGSNSGWDQRPDGGQGVKGPSSDRPWKSKGSTKKATPATKDWNDPSETKPGKPWKDEENVPKTVNNMKGEAGMKEEKIVWSHQISSNGELGNGWVPITLRPNTKKPTNQTQDNNNKGSSKSSGDWSDVKQQMDGWDNAGLTHNTPIPQFKMDLITENVPSSSQMPDASNGHPFYIPLVNRRSKRANRLISLTKKYIRPKTARRIYKVINSRKDIGSIKTDENLRFYLASANILVGDDDTTKHINRTNDSRTGEENISSLFKSHIRYNETIKNSIPSLKRLKHLRNNLVKRNSTLKYVNKLTEQENETLIQNNIPSSFNLDNGNLTLRNMEASKAYPKIENSSFEIVNKKDSGKDRIWDSLMEESETKELWSSPFDSSNVPESGWIPLFKVNKTSRTVASPNILENQNNITEVGDTEHHFGNAKDLEQTESVVFLDSPNDNSKKEYGTLPNDTFNNSSTEEWSSEFDFEHRPTHNFTIDIDADEFAMNSEQELKDGNKTLRIIPFSNIMKQLRRNESSNDEIETTTSPAFSNKDEWNIPITATPKMYNLKLVNDSEMQSGNVGSSWTFHKGKPKRPESWILVNGDGVQNTTARLKNYTFVDNRHKYNNNSHKNSTLYRLIVGNRTREIDLSELSHKTEEARSKPETEDPARSRFSFGLNNWHKDSGWTPLVRAIGSVTTRKVDHGKIQSIS